MKNYYMTILVNCAGYIQRMSLYIHAENFTKSLEILRTRYGEIHNIVKILSIKEDNKYINENELDRFYDKD